MKRHLLGIVFLALWSVAALAGDTVTVTRIECGKVMRHAVRHQPAPDVAYQPGIDVHGRPGIEIPEEISLDIGIGLAEKYGFPESIEAEVVLGTVKVRERRVYWNGRLLDDGDQSSVAEACREVFGEDGQSRVDSPGRRWKNRIPANCVDRR